MGAETETLKHYGEDVYGAEIHIRNRDQTVFLHTRATVRKLRTDGCQVGVPNLPVARIHLDMAIEIRIPSLLDVSITGYVFAPAREDPYWGAWIPVAFADLPHPAAAEMAAHMRARVLDQRENARQLAVEARERRGIRRWLRVTGWALTGLFTSVGVFTIVHWGRTEWLEWEVRQDVAMVMKLVEAEDLSGEDIERAKVLLRRYGSPAYVEQVRRTLSPGQRRRLLESISQDQLREILKEIPEQQQRGLKAAMKDEELGTLREKLRSR